jgi:4-aminobutyrate aminotransferase-like enzyme
MDAWPPSNGEALHTSTFLGNPLGCAMALASLEEHARPELAAQVRERGERVLAALRAIRSPHIAEVRGLGLLVGMELRLDGATANAIVKRALADGLILLQSGPAGNVLSFTPPFAISDEEIAFTAGRLAGYLQAVL